MNTNHSFRKSHFLDIPFNFFGSACFGFFLNVFFAISPMASKRQQIWLLKAEVACSRTLASKRQQIWLVVAQFPFFVFLTAQMSVFMVLCGPLLPLAFQFVCGPGGGGELANKLEDMWKVSLCLVAPPQAAAGYSTNSSSCWRTTFEDICAVRNPFSGLPDSGIPYR